jgi:beta-lactamase regulating signal transducer with metallopeptidase domain
MPHRLQAVVTLLCAADHHQQQQRRRRRRRQHERTATRCREFVNTPVILLNYHSSSSSGSEMQSLRTTERSLKGKNLSHSQGHPIVESDANHPIQPYVRGREDPRDRDVGIPSVLVILLIFLVFVIVGSLMTLRRRYIIRQRQQQELEPRSRSENCENIESTIDKKKRIEVALHQKRCLMVSQV